jgi:hypothetical protein
VPDLRPVTSLCRTRGPSKAGLEAGGLDVPQISDLLGLARGKFNYVLTGGLSPFRYATTQSQSTLISQVLISTQKLVLLNGKNNHIIC